jgi:transcriptional regulator with XRE-family HTH domain
MENNKYQKFRYIGKKIKEIRELRNLKQKDLSERIGKSAAYLNAVEKGNKKPSLDLIISIADALDIDPGEIMFRSANISQIKKILQKSNFTQLLEELKSNFQLLKKNSG